MLIQAISIYQQEYKHSKKHYTEEKKMHKQEEEMNLI